MAELYNNYKQGKIDKDSTKIKIIKELTPYIVINEIKPDNLPNEIELGTISINEIIFQKSYQLIVDLKLYQILKKKLKLKISLFHILKNIKVDFFSKNLRKKLDLKHIAEI